MDMGLLGNGGGVDEGKILENIHIKIHGNFRWKIMLNEDVNKTHG